MKYHFDSFTRYYLLISLLSSWESGFTIRELAEALEISIEIIRNDLASFSSLPTLKRYLIIKSPDTPVSEDSDQYFFDFVLAQKAAFPEMKRQSEKALYSHVSQQFHNGEFDDYHFYLSRSIQLSSEDVVFLPLLPDEHSALLECYPDFAKKHSNSVIPVKTTTLPLTGKQNEWISIIEKAICEQCAIRFIYQDKSLEDIIFPHHIFRNADDDFAYCIGRNDEIRRLDKCQRVIREPKMHANSSVTDTAVCRWGASTNVPPDPIDIELRIVSTTPNLVAKFKADTTLRKYGHFDEDTLTYTDQIIDTDAFRRWLRKYGSSVVVVKPRFLAVEMLENARLMLENYIIDEATSFTI